jgi:hypothetical protein
MPVQPTGYLALLRRIHRCLRPRTYVEIGVADGTSLAQAPAETLKVAIDPCIGSTQPASSSLKYFELESDKFFEQNDLRAVLNGRHVDIAFIDGMHLFEFALRDFMNLERFCSDDSVVLIHDCYPLNREMTTREPRPSGEEIAWTGDVWKLIVCLKQYRPDLRVSVVDSPPTGLGIITGLDPDSSVLKDRYAEICATFVDLDYSVLDGRKEEELNLVPDTWDVVRSLLPSVSDERVLERGAVRS